MGTGKRGFSVGPGHGQQVDKDGLVRKNTKETVNRLVCGEGFRGGGERAA